MWATEEDEAIRNLVTKYGTKSWSVIAEHIIKEYGITGRTGKQCRERWHNHLGNKNNIMNIFIDPYLPILILKILISIKHHGQKKKNV